jgi:hypothetical protein
MRSIQRVTAQHQCDGRPLELSDRSRISGLLSDTGRAPSEHCFANLFLFRERHRYNLCETPVPHVRGLTYDGVIHALPLAPVDAEVARGLFESGVDCLFPIGTGAEVLAGALELVAWAVDADSDYWYDGPTMATLSGAKQRRAQARAYEAEHAPRLESWTSALVADAEAILDGWLADVQRRTEDTDVVECAEAIRLADVLGLEGALVRTAGGIPVAFLLASVTADGSRVIHFAKGRRAHSGAYPWLFCHYAKQTRALKLNFEQDLGNPGLAQSKRAYAPIDRVQKFRLSRPD